MNNKVLEWQCLYPTLGLRPSSVFPLDCRFMDAVIWWCFFFFFSPSLSISGAWDRAWYEIDAH